MSVVQPATAPEAPSNPNKKIIIPLGLILGLMAGVALAFLLENFDTTMHSSEEIAKRVELPVLGRIPSGTRGRLTVFFPEKSPQEESFRRLRTTIFALDPNAELRSLMVTSAQPSEGKSTTVANLALAIAQAGRRVIVVDGDLRKPTMHRVFRVGNSVGLSNVLTREVALDEAIQYSMIPGVQVLAAGPASPNPAELLGLPEMSEAIEELSKQFDFVLIDAPSLQTVADAAVLSLIVDRVVVVVARGVVRQETVDSALDELASVHCKPMGVVVSRAERTSDFHYDRASEGHTLAGPRSPRGGRPRSAIPALRRDLTEALGRLRLTQSNDLERGQALRLRLSSTNLSPMLRQARASCDDSRTSVDSTEMMEVQANATTTSSAQRTIAEPDGSDAIGLHNLPADEARV